MPKKPRIYKGWIPTVSGRLSFDVIGTGSHPNPPDCMNVADSKRRYILCRQERILLDNALVFTQKAALVRHLYKEVGKFQFICIASASNDPKDLDGSLSGFIYIYEDSIWEKCLWKEFEDRQASLLNYWNQLSLRSLESCFSAEYNVLQIYLRDHSYFYVPFTLKRNGTTALYVSDECFENPGAPAVGADQPSHVEHSVCSQAFFFLKDILHNHQHHDPYTDTLSDIYVVNNDDDDYDWRCEAVRLLYRMILTYKRNKKEEICNSALGIIAYVRSFRGISNAELSKNIKYQDHLSRLHPDRNDDLLQESIRASQDSLRNFLQERIRKSDKLSNLLLAFLTTVVSVVGMLQITKITYEKEEISPVFIFLSWLVLSQPMLCLTALGVLAFFFAERWGVVSFSRNTDVYRVIVTQDQRKAEQVLNLIGFVVVTMTMLLAAYLEEFLLFMKSILF